MTSSNALGAARSDVEVETRSAEETRSFAAHLAAVAARGDRIALIGPLGAGKTQFAKGFASGLGISATVNSPSFTLMAEYTGRLPLFHQDLYRLAGSNEALDGGLLDERQNDGVTLSEWAERLDEQLDPDNLEVRFTLVGDEERRIVLVLHGRGNAAYLEAARAWKPGRTLVPV
jgi:tRNA threonylcarbamoyladenosine biosynthesis protein TsaE